MRKVVAGKKNLRMDIGDTALRVSRCRHHRNLFLAKSDKMISKQKSFIFLFSNLTVSPSETKMSAFAPLALEITDFVFGKSRFKRPSYHFKLFMEYNKKQKALPLMYFISHLCRWYGRRGRGCSARTGGWDQAAGQDPRLSQPDLTMLVNALQWLNIKRHKRTNDVKVMRIEVQTCSITGSMRIASLATMSANR